MARIRKSKNFIFYVSTIGRGFLRRNKRKKLMGARRLYTRNTFLDLKKAMSVLLITRRMACLNQPDRSLYKSSGKKYTEEEKKETRLGDSKEKVCLFGKKVVQRRGKEMLVREEDRTGMKRAYIWKEEKVYVATDDWHDKE